MLAGVLYTFIFLLSALANCTAFADGAEIHKHSTEFTLNILKESKPEDSRTYLINPKDIWLQAFSYGDVNHLANSRGLAECRNKVMRRTQFYSSYLFDDNDCSKNYTLPSQKLDGFLLMRTATNRMITRFSYEQLKRNEALKVIIDGKFDFDFSFGDIFDKISSISTESDNQDDLRPVYVLYVNNEPNHLGLNLNNEAERKIIEHWPKSSSDHKNRPELEQKTTFQELSYGQRLAHTYGLAYTPFSKFKIKFEKSSGLSMDIKIKLNELNNLFYADVTPLVFNSNLDAVAFGFRIPYAGHAIGADYKNRNTEPVAYYSFSKNQKNAKLVFNRANNALGFEFKMSI